MNCRERLEAYLRENEVPYQLQHHPTAYTAQEVAAREHVPGKMLAKVVIVFADTKMVMLALTAPQQVDLERVKGMLGAREVRLAREAEFAAAFPDCEVGAMPPFGNLYGVPVYVDRRLAEDETIMFQIGTHTDTMSLKYADFERLVKPKVSEFARHA
ncbi:MAG: YbaK/EbsC family protein [Bacteroidetes bacterium]|nr:YbaK/EbsC family protein [Bacteroidota bacterium]MCL5025985.1 YbaK/EbsC family protein [Chloroflexota bacterium]